MGPRRHARDLLRFWIFSTKFDFRGKRNGFSRQMKWHTLASPISGFAESGRKMSKIKKAKSNHKDAFSFSKKGRYSDGNSKHFIVKGLHCDLTCHKMSIQTKNKSQLPQKGADSLLARLNRFWLRISSQLSAVTLFGTAMRGRRGKWYRASGFCSVSSLYENFEDRSDAAGRDPAERSPASCTNSRRM